MSQHITQKSQKAGLLDNFALLDISGNSHSATQPSTHPPTPTHMSVQPGSAHTNPVEDDTPDKTSGTTNPNAEVAAFAKAIERIIMASNTHAKPKLWEPNPFNGSDSHKLCTFILQCKLNFWEHPDLFLDNTAKVNYTLSFLKGSALDCFEPTLLDPTGSQISNCSPRNSKLISEPMIQLAKQKPNLKDFANKRTIKLQSTSSIPAASHTCPVGWSSTLQTGLLQWTHQMHQRWHGPPWEAKLTFWSPETCASHRCTILGMTWGSFS